MAYNPTPVGVAVHQEPGRAHEMLVELFKRCAGSRRRVAEQLGVDESTLHRWIQKLRAAGFEDPRAAA